MQCHSSYLSKIYCLFISFQKYLLRFLHSIKWLVNNTNWSCVEDEFKHFLLENATFVAFYCPYLFSSHITSKIRITRYQYASLIYICQYTNYISRRKACYVLFPILIHIINFIMISCNDWDYFHINQQQKQYNKTTKMKIIK